MFFWATAAAVALLAALILARPLLAARRGAAPRAAHDMQVYRDQLAAVEVDLARGVLTGAEAEGARAEVSRRLLTAADKAEAETGARPAPRALSRGAAVLLVAVTVAAALGLYARLGAPGQHDLPLAARLAEIREAAATRPDQATAERMFAEEREAAPPREVPAETQELIDRLTEVVAGRPADVRGRRLLAGALMGVGRPLEARRVYDELIPLLGDAATAEDYANAAEAMVLAAGGYVSPEAESALGAALRREPEHETARYYAGLSMAQNGRPDLALSIWRRLLAEAPEDAPWRGAVSAQIDRLAAMTGQAPAPPGPSREEMEAAEEMSPEEREAMIEGMVARLEDRLATEGGPPAEWGRLIRAYGVLGREEDVRRIWTDAQEVFAEDPEALAEIRAAGGLGE